MRSPKTAFDLRAALTEEVHAAMEEFDAAAADPAALHRCRVRLKRARALARVGRECAPGLSAVFLDCARVVMRSLAYERELIALCGVARSLADSEGKTAAAALAATADNLDAERASLAAEDPGGLRAQLKDLLALAQVWPEASARQISKGARRLERRARRARRRGRGAAAPERRHQWRKREKDRYYAALLLAGAWPGRRRRKIGAKLGDVLGDERDTMLLMQRLEAEPALAGDPARLKRTLAALGRRRKRLARRADDLAQKLAR